MKKPTLQEIKDYIATKEYNVDPQTFYDYYTESDWKDCKGKPVKNWKLKVITWNGRQKAKAVDNTGNWEDYL